MPQVRKPDAFTQSHRKRYAKKGRFCMNRDARATLRPSNHPDDTNVPPTEPNGRYGLPVESLGDSPHCTG